ncbi:Atg14 domain-containing protein [Acinetobacter seifertii]|uniref:plasmid replication DNA-binding protein n=1 Tax=Acinetobacter seifertii TaxID=1530123 RepID=UPI002940E8EF|nr:plasmid replication DNA-binding protein [Acinetobacter seifertii]MDV4266076.1 Atg14 domain-containing protein [Acinetobacter seifertii]
MARITVTQASKDFNVSRNTLYKKIKQGHLTKDANGLLDVNDLIRIIGVHTENTHKNVTLNNSDVQSVNSDTQLQQAKNEIEQLKQLLAQKEIFINQLQQQIADLRLDKEQLYNQINQKRIEHKKSLLGRFFG